ncbi:S1C family serine protease [Curvibacter lanceolatus]|uniref:S1C family serine protease n=1 Tax=Curvibacter lanceolatus TaxID=86182 RepID=UPI0004CDE07E|nr:trypsin-like peptidase domain-containing protein [Curvibacter lanceolatus]
MRRPALYIPPRPSATTQAQEPLPAPADVSRPSAVSRATEAPAARGEAASTSPTPTAPAPPARRPPWRRHAPAWISAIALLLAGLLLGWQLASRPQALTQHDIDAAVRHSLETQPLRSPVAQAAERVAPSVVRVVGFGHDGADRPAHRGSTRGRAQGRDERETSVGTGVVLVDSGLILTNLHVVKGAERIGLVFSDGLRAGATLVASRPEQDLAVLQASRIPDDLVAATLASSTSLRLGDMVGVIGFPYGIGPSVSAGVVSGLEREFESPQGRHTLNHMIQFDAAANPGNSGGPLFTAQGEVVGIVTAILNPGPAKTFIGIGFAVPIESAATAAGMPPF